jgi:hypothetical protein
VQGLRCEARVDAARAQETELACPRAVGSVDDVSLDLEVVADEVSRIGVVRDDAADLCGGEEHVVRPLSGEKTVDGRTVAQLERASARGNDTREAARRESAANGRADEAAGSGNEDLGFLLHS